MNHSKPTPFQIAIITIDVIIVFLLSVLGNQITIDVPRVVLLGAIAILLVISIFATSARSFPEFFSMLSVERFQKMIPKTMASIFPLGVLIGFIGGVFVASYKTSSVSWGGEGEWAIYFNPPGVLIGLIIGILLAIVINRYLGGAIFLGYMFGMPLAISIIRPAPNDLVVSTLANLCLAIPLSFLIIFAMPIVKRIFDAFSEPRI